MIRRERPQPMAHRRAAVLAAFVLAAIGVHHAFSVWPSATTHLRDDAFYEFLFAENLAAGRGPIVTGDQWTSGVQPLWCMLLALCALVGLSVPKAAVVLGVSCHLVAAVLWVTALRRTWIGVVAGAVWLGNPLLLRECQNGQETALGALFAVLLWNARRVRLSRFCDLAALAGLARADLFAFSIALTLARPRTSLLLRFAAAGLPLVPWLLWNRVTGGGYLPDSSLPMAWLAHAQFERTAPTFVEGLRQTWWYLRPVLFGAPFALAGAVGTALLLAEVLRPLVARIAPWGPIAIVAAASLLGADDLGVPILASTFLLLAPGARTFAGSRPWSRVPRAEVWLLLAGLGVVALHWAVRWYPRDYYLAPLAVLAVAGFVRARRRPWLVFLALLCQLVFALRVPLAHEDLRHQAAMQVAGAVLHPLLGDRARVGSFNCGLIAWEQRRHGTAAPVVFGLDGVVDARALLALRYGIVDDHLDLRDVRYLVDFPVQWSMAKGELHACGPWFRRGDDPAPHLAEIVRCVAPDVGAGPGAEVVLVARRPSGAVPDLGREPRFVARTDAGAPVLLWPARKGEVLEIGGGAHFTPWFTASADAVYALGCPPNGQIRVVGQEDPIPSASIR